MGRNMNDSPLQRLRELAAEMARLNTECVNHPGIEAVWEKMADLLSRDVDLTCDLLKRCETDEMYWISGVFDNVSDALQSPQFIECLEELRKKHASLDMSVDIDFARQALGNPGSTEIVRREP